MAQPDHAEVRELAKALATKDGFTWELDYGTPGRARLGGQRFLSKDRQEEYLERARADLRKAASNA